MLLLPVQFALSIRVGPVGVFYILGIRAGVLNDNTWSTIYRMSLITGGLLPLLVTARDISPAHATHPMQLNF